MSDCIRFKFLKIVISPTSDNKCNRFKFLAKDLDEFYHLKMLNVSFGYDTDEL